MAYSMKQIIMLVITFMVIGLILPLGLVYLGTMGDSNVIVNGTLYSVSEVVDPSLITLLTVLLPIVAIIGIIIAFLPRGKD